MKIKALIGFLILSAGLFAQTTTYTGTVRDLSNSVVTSGNVTFTLTPSVDTTISGTSRFSPLTVTCTINGSGALVAADGVSACVVTQNTALTPTGTSYKICIQPYFTSPGSCFVDYAVTSSKDISTVAPTPQLSPNYPISYLNSINYWPLSQTFANINGVVIAGTAAYPTLSSALAALPVGGGTVYLVNPYTETLAADVMLPNKNITIRALGSAVFTMGAHSIIIPVGNHNVMIAGAIPWAQYSGPVTPGLFFGGYSGSSCVICVGAGSALTQNFVFEDAMVSLNGSGNGAVGISLTATQYTQLRRFSVLGGVGTSQIGVRVQGGNSSSFTSFYNTIDQAHIVMQSASSWGVLYGTTGTGPANANRITNSQILGSGGALFGVSYTGPAVGNWIIATDLEGFTNGSSGVGINYGSNASNNYALASGENNDFDVKFGASTLQNEVHFAHNDALADATVSDAGTNNQVFGRMGNLTSGNFAVNGSLMVNGAAASGDVINATTATVNHKTLRLSNTGGGLVVGIDDSTSSTFAHGNYVSNWYSPSNNSYFSTPLATFSGAVNALAYATATNCASSGGTCLAAAAGRVSIAAAATTVTVATTAVTANSEIIVKRDNSLGAALSVTCNTQSSLVLGTPYVSARTAGTNFTITIDVAPTTNPLCMSYQVVN